MTNSRRTLRIVQAAVLILAITLNFSVGALAAKRYTGDVPPLALVDDIRDPAPTVRIDGVRNGKLEGEILGDARFIVGGEMVVPTAGQFAVNASSVLINRITVHVPEGMRFVASKKGKYYYTVTSAKGENLSPTNRVYFATEEDAANAGFTRGFK